MTEDGSRGLASGMLGLLSFVARLFGKDVTPEKHEIETLGRALSQVAYRRASWVGGGDDIFALAFALGAFAFRVKAAPNVVRAPGLRLVPSSPPPTSSPSSSSASPVAGA
jgi:hypothetical protein